MDQGGKSVKTPELASFDLAVFGVSVRVEALPEKIAELKQQWAWCLPGAVSDRPLAADAKSDIDLSVRPLATVTHYRPDTDSEGNPLLASITPQDDPDFWPRCDYGLTTSVTTEGIEARAGQLLMLHACVLSEPHGGAVVMVGRSGAGKTTATQELTRLGMGYVSDETAILNRDGQIMPYPKPLSVIVASGSTKEQLSPETLGLEKPPDDLRVNAFVNLNRLTSSEQIKETEGAVPRLEPMDLIDAMLAVIGQSSALPSLPDPLLRLAQQLQETGCFSLVYTEIADAAHLVRALCARRQPMKVQFEHAPPPPELVLEVSYTGFVPDEDVQIKSTDQWVRAAYTDALWVEGEVLVLVGNHPIRLTGLGALAWEVADSAVNYADLRAEAEGLFGPHPDADALVLDALQTLLEHRVIRLVPTPDTADSLAF